MPNPIITPGAWAAATPFTIQNSSFVALDIALANIDAAEAQVLVTVPAGATVTAIRNPVNWTGAGATLLTGGVWAGPTILADWNLTIGQGAAPTDPTTLGLTSPTSGASGRLRLVFKGLTGQLSVEPVTGEVSIDRVLAAPSITNEQVSNPPLPVRELDDVALSASVAQTRVENPAPVLVPPAPPPLLSVWSPAPGNTIAIPSFVSVGATATFTAPAVYAATLVNFTLKAALDLGANGIIDGTDPFTTTSLPVTVELARYGMVLVLDRSGSMGSSLGGGISKWQAAVQAAHAWADLFRAFRPGGNHLAGVVTFENNAGGWTLSPDAEVTFRNPSGGAAVAGPAPLVALAGFGDVTTWNLGTDQSSTPIGDGLVKAWTAIGAQLVPGNRAAVVLMTDGYENSGAITIAATKGAASATFATARSSGGLSAANGMIGTRLYTLALGTQVDDQRLNVLGAAYYQQITTSVNEVTPAFAGMLGHALHADPVMPQPPMAADPDAAANALYYRVSTGERVLAFLAHWPSNTDALRIGHRPQGSAAAFTLLAPGPQVSVTKRETHGLTRVDLPGLIGAGALATEWRFQHIDAGLVPQPNLVDRALVMVDLVTKVDVGFSRPQFFVGEQIGLETRIFMGGLPVTGATVLVDSARPGESLGTYLTQNAPKYKDRHGDVPRSKTDPGKGKGLMVSALFQMDGIEMLPIINDTGLLLRDDGANADRVADDGFYANVFPDTVTEGTYTFRFRVEGTLPDGSEFSRVFVRSTWVGLRPDPAQLGAVWKLLTDGDTQPARSLLTIKPMYGKHYLGPFQRDAITLKIFDGQFDGDLIDQVDGSYQITVIHDIGAKPTVTVAIWGQDMNPSSPVPFTPLGTGCWKLWLAAIRCTFAAILKLFGKK